MGKLAEKDRSVMRMRRRPSHSFLTILFIFFVMSVLAFTAPGQAQSADSRCTSVWERWETAFKELNLKLGELLTVEKTPVEQVIQRPLLQAGEGKTLAAQVSEALQAKEQILKGKRSECRDVLNQEEQLFTELQECLKDTNSTGRREVRNLVRQRNALIEKATVALAEVREVEGQETMLPYSASVRQQQDYYRQGANNYWQSYQQMYRRWWGY